MQFGRDICGNLAIAEKREWLVTNGIGGYACGTLAGMLTRHYHGLLVAALKPPLERTLLLAKLDEVVEYGQQPYALGCDRWSDGTISSHGYQHIQRFSLEGTVAVWTYAFGDALLEKRIWMEPGFNTTYIRYTLSRGSAPLQFSCKALVNYRNHHGDTQGGWSMATQPLTNGVKVTAFEQAIPLVLKSDTGSCCLHHTWHYGYFLAVEAYRGIFPYDDHLHIASFEAVLNPGQSLTLVASTEATAEAEGFSALLRRRAYEESLIHLVESSQPNFFQSSLALQKPLLSRLLLASDQFIVGRNSRTTVGKTIIAGYPWFGDWGRDTMIALPGLTLTTQRFDVARSILQIFAKYLDQGMLPNMFPEDGVRPAYNTVDAILWYFEALRAYYAATQDDQLLAELFPALVEVIQWHQRGTRHNIHLDHDGLLYAGTAGEQLTWMDAKVDDWVVTPRIGKPIEVNALWYNALVAMAEFAEQLGRPSALYRQLAEKTQQGFQRFWNHRLQYCYDLIDGPEGHDNTLRPNQVFAVALPAFSGDSIPPLLQASQQKAVVDVTAQTLLTSYGLRSLAADHPSYQGIYGGDRYQRDGAYHQGPVWGWLIGPFIRAHLKVYQNPEMAHSFLEPLLDHLHDGCVGNLSEIFDGDAPFIPRGAFAQAWTVAEVLRSLELIYADQ